MKVPLRWLRHYIDVSLTVPQLAERLTLAGLEVIGYRFIGLPVPDGIHIKPDEAGPVWERDKIVTAQILKIDKHPNADKLKLVTLDCGAGQPKTVVTGAPNIDVGHSGLKVILGLAGTKYWFENKEQKKELAELKPKELRGIMNDAMCMSEFELGITDEHEGIIILDPTAPVGVPLADFMGDAVLEIDVLPNMARCLSMIGVAREVAALTGGSLKKPDLSLPRTGEQTSNLVKVSIDNSKLSARYQAMVIRGVKIGPSPGWMQRDLNYAGMRPISNIVDITNFVMLEWGQPLHAFDYDVLVKRANGKIPHIIVRPARAGEKLKTLDNQDRELNPDILVIADEAGPIALAGVMGGLETEVTAQTTNILLESANFDYVSIRRTTRALNLPSEASMRFSKGVHPELVKPAADRAAQLMAKHASGNVCAGAVDCYPAPPPPRTIDLKLADVSRLLGMDFPAVDAERILKALEYRVERNGDLIKSTVPAHRLDIQVGAADLIEDLARIYGYERLPATLISAPLPDQRGNRTLVLEECTRNLLVEAGLQEAITYALTTPEREAPLADPAEYVKILNPINADRVAMRRTLLAGMLESVRENLKNFSTVKLFEIGAVFWPQAGEKLPLEPARLGLVMAGRRGGDFWAESGAGPGPDLDFFDLKGVIESLAEGLHLPCAAFRPSSVSWLHPGQAAELVIDGVAAGSFGRLHPRITPQFGKELGERAVLVAELDLTAILAKVPERHRYQPIIQFPKVLRDIAVVVPEETPAYKVLAELRSGGGELLRAAALFDVYRGDSIPSGTKSLAYALTYQANNTLTDKEVDKVHKRIEDRLVHVLKAQIRGK
jgi:phenylalanyl-tRNA synthetase beta chain